MEYRYQSTFKLNICIIFLLISFTIFIYHHLFVVFVAFVALILIHNSLLSNT